jgi:hypothetical protein
VVVATTATASMGSWVGTRSVGCTFFRPEKDE